MESAPTLAPQSTTAAPPTGPTINVSSDDFFNDTPSSSPAPTTADPATTTAPAAPSAAPVVATPLASTPATPTATPDPATAAPTAAPAFDANDPWASLGVDAPTTEGGEAATTTTNTDLIDGRVTLLAQTLGIENLPDTPEEIQAALENEVTRRVQIATHDPIRQVDQQLSLSDLDLVRSAMLQNRQSFQTPEDIEAQLDAMDDNRLGQAAQSIRQQLNSFKDTESTRKATEIAQQQQQTAEEARVQREAYQTAQRNMLNAVDGFKDPFGKALPDAVKNIVRQYGVHSQQYFQDFFNQPESWHVERMLEMNPRTAPVYAQMKQNLAKQQGASNVYKELEQSRPQVGGGAATASGIQSVSVDDFFS